MTTATGAERSTDGWVVLGGRVRPCHDLGQGRLLVMGTGGRWLKRERLRSEFGDVHPTREAAQEACLRHRGFLRRLVGVEHAARAMLACEDAPLPSEALLAAAAEAYWKSVADGRWPAATLMFSVIAAEHAALDGSADGLASLMALEAKTSRTLVTCNARAALTDIIRGMLADLGAAAPACRMPADVLH